MIATYTAEGKKFSNPKYLRNRIKERTATIRLPERHLRGKFYTWSEPREVSQKEKLFYTEKLEQEKEKLDFYISCMKKVNPEYEYIADNRKGKQKKL